MAAGITLATAARNAAADAILALINISGPGTLQIGTGTTTDVGFGTVLATIPMAATAFAAASNGTATANSLPRTDSAADASGTAAAFRFRNGTPATVFFGSVKTSDDGSDIVLTDLARNAALNAINALINTGSGTATIQFAAAADTTFTSPLVSFNLPNPAFGAAAAGAIALNGPLTGTGTVGGTAGLFRVRDRNSAEVFRGSVGTAGEDINMANPVIGVGAAVTLSTYSLVMALTSAASSAVLAVASGLVFTAGEQIDLTVGSFTQPA